MPKKFEKEKYLERKLVDEVEKVGGWCLKFWPISISGFPDRFCLFPGGKIGFAEIKETGVKLDKLQVVWQKKLQKLGFVSVKIDTSEKIDEFIKLFT